MRKPIVDEGQDGELFELFRQNFPSRRDEATFILRVIETGQTSGECARRLAVVLTHHRTFLRQEPGARMPPRERLSDDEFATRLVHLRPYTRRWTDYGREARLPVEELAREIWSDLERLPTADRVVGLAYILEQLTPYRRITLNQIRYDLGQVEVVDDDPCRERRARLMQAARTAGSPMAAVALAIRMLRTVEDDAELMILLLDAARYISSPENEEIEDDDVVPL